MATDLVAHRVPLTLKAQYSGSEKLFKHAILCIELFRKWGFPVDKLGMNRARRRQARMGQGLYEIVESRATKPRVEGGA
jgi:hypothetical protein